MARPQAWAPGAVSTLTGSWMRRLALGLRVASSCPRCCTKSRTQAALADSEAQARKSTADLRRNEELISDGSVSRRELDVTRAANAQTVAAATEVLSASSAEIGRALHLSPKTVDTYRSRIMTKLEVPDVPALVRLAIREGLISADEM